MRDERTGKELSEFPVLEDGQIRLYVLENNFGHIKIGITTNVKQRIDSYGRSNGQGVTEIKRVLVSPPTWLKSMEGTIHNHYDWYRIEGTEWFCDKRNTGELTFEKVCEYMKLLFSSASYKRCNELRKKVTLNDNQRN